MARNALFGLKRIFFDRIFQKSFWTWRKHPVIIIPTMLGSALQLILQSILTLVLMLLLTGWAFAGSLTGFLTEYSNAGLFAVFQDPAFSFTLVPVVAVTVVALVLVAVLGGGYVYSAEYGMYVFAWNGDSVPVKSVLENGSRRWRPMAWTLLLSNLITWGPAVIGYLLIVASAASVNSTTSLVALLAASSVFQPLLFASLILAVFTVYSYPAVVVDRVSGLRAIRQSFRAASHNLGITLTYVVVRIIFQALLLLVVLLASVIGLPLTSLITVVLSFLLTPILHLTKTMIYYHAGSSIPEMPFQISNPIWQDMFRRLPRAAWLKIKMGLAEGFKFVIGPRSLPFHILSALGVLVAPQLSPSLTMFFAAILPHGIIEIPSFVLSGSVGMRLGYAALKTKFRRGPESDEYLSKTLRVAVYVVVGLAPLFLIAGLIEADITPIIMRMFGWVV